MRANADNSHMVKSRPGSVHPGEDWILDAAPGQTECANILERILKGGDKAVMNMGRDHSLFKIIEGVPHDELRRRVRAVIERYSGAEFAKQVELLKKIAEKNGSQMTIPSTPIAGAEWAEKEHYRIELEVEPPSASANLMHSLGIKMDLEGTLLDFRHLLVMVDPIGEKHLAGSWDVIEDLSTEVAEKVARAVVGAISNWSREH